MLIDTGSKTALPNLLERDIPEVVACLQIDCNGRVWEVLKVDSQDLLRHVVVVQLVVAESNVDVQRQVFSIVQQYSLVNINGFLVVGPITGY